MLLFAILGGAAMALVALAAAEAFDERRRNTTRASRQRDLDTLREIRMNTTTARLLMTQDLRILRRPTGGSLDEHP